jgi:hypothetical protein
VRKNKKQAPSSPQANKTQHIMPPSIEAAFAVWTTPPAATTRRRHEKRRKRKRKERRRTQTRPTNLALRFWLFLSCLTRAFKPIQSFLLVSYFLVLSDLWYFG